MNNFLTYFFIAIVLVVVVTMVTRDNSFPLPEGETSTIVSKSAVGELRDPETSKRQKLETGGVTHSIPLEEIHNGGPGKDGIPSIDEPIFLTLEEADEILEDDAIGLGLVLGEEARFYPFQILVWHEIVNDIIEVDGENHPVAVTYCPLCGTGIVFDAQVNGEIQEFGVSGMLWESNLLMYNRTGNPDTESLWSQVLGEAVVGPKTGTKLAVIPSDTVTYKMWKESHPKTRVLSQETGHARQYGHDPYGAYYTNEDQIFPTSNEDTRLHPKTVILGLEIDGQFKAYIKEDISIGDTVDDFAGMTITITKNEFGEVRFSAAEGKVLAPVEAFWFSWVGVHPESEIYNQ